MARRRLFQFPLDFVEDTNWRAHMTAPFAEDRGTHEHTGTDFGADAGTPIYPIFDGTIDSWGNHAVYGNYVIVKHDEASYSYYYHMLHRSNYDAGEPVEKHHVIGHVGSTGQSSGPHLHVGVSGRPDFTGFVDPVPYILERYWYDDGIPEPTVPAPVEPVPVPVPPTPEIPRVDPPAVPAPATPERVALTVDELLELTRAGVVEGKRPPVPDWLAHAAYWTAGGMMVAAPFIFGQLALNGLVTGEYALQQVAILEAAAGSLAGLTGVARFKRVKS